MGGREQTVEERESIVYCVVPRALARKLHEPLRRHFADDPAVEVVVEQRRADRRARAERRVMNQEPTGERRRIRNAAGRRIGERRAAAVAAGAPPIPRRLARYASELSFVALLVPSSSHLEDLDTARLVTRIQAGESDSFADLYTRYFDRVYAYLKIALNDPHEAEDLTQQVFIKVLEGLARYERRRQPFRAWLFTIVRNTAVTQIEKRSRTSLVDPVQLREERDRDEVDDRELEALGWITDRELLMFIERLPPAQKQVLVLKYMLGLTTSETAAVLKRTPGDVRSLHSRALGFLRQRLQSVGRGAPHSGEIRMRRWVKPAQVIRRRRFALLK